MDLVPITYKRVILVELNTLHLFPAKKKKHFAFVIFGIGHFKIINGMFFADFPFTVPAELDSALRLKTVQYLVTKRPWLGSP